MSCCTPQTISGFPHQVLTLTDEPIEVFGAVRQGDDFTVSLLYVDLNQAVIDLTGQTFLLSIDWECLNCRWLVTPLYTAEAAGDNTGAINFSVPGFGASNYPNPWWAYVTPCPTLPTGPLKLEIKRWSPTLRSTAMVGDLLVQISLSRQASPLPMVNPYRRFR